MYSRFIEETVAEHNCNALKDIPETEKETFSLNAVSNIMIQHR